MKVKPEDEVGFTPISNPSQSDYQRKFDPTEAGKNNRPDAGSGDGGQTINPSYSSDPERNELADLENNANNETAAAQKELMNYRGEGSSPAKGFFASKALGSGRSKINKRVRMGIFGVFGFGSILVVLIMLFMLASGFGVKHLAEVVKGYTSYRMNRIGYTMTTRLLEGDVRVKSGAGLARVTPGSALDKLRGFDIEKVLKNLEKTEAITYTRGSGGKVTGIKFRGGSEVSLDGGRFNPSKRADIYRDISAGIKTVSPELAETSHLVGKTSDGIFERVGLKRVRWSEKQLAKIRAQKDAVKQLSVEQTDQLERVRGPSSIPETGEPRIDAARRVADDLIPEESIASVPDPTDSVKVKSAQVDAIDSAGPYLSRSAAGQVIEGASTVAIYTLCTINGVVKAQEGIIRQNNDAAIRMGGQLQSLGDQVEKGGITTSAAAMGASRKMLHNFNNEASYQLSVGNKNWSNFQQLPKIDQPQPNPNKGWLSLFNQISSASNSFWDALIRPLLFLAERAGKDTSFTGFCRLINDPLWGTVFGIATGVLEQFITNSFAPASSTVIKEGAEEASETIFRRLFSNVAEKFTLQYLRGRVESRVGAEIGDGFTRALLKALGRNVAKGAAIGGSIFGLSYLIIKLADGTGGFTYNGAGDDYYASKAKAGSNLTNNDFERSRYMGVPLDDAEAITYVNSQFADMRKEQKQKSFFARMLDSDNPYSLVSRVAAQSPYDTATTKQFALTAVNPMNTLSLSQNSVSELANSSVLGDNVAIAQTAEDAAVANDNVIQWSYTPEELSLIKQEEYNLENISVWAGTPSGVSAIAKYDRQFGLCYQTKYEMSDIILWHDRSGKEIRNADGRRADKLCLEDLPRINKQTTNILKWRLYRADILHVDEFIDLETVTADTAQTGGSGGGGDGGGEETEVEAGEITADSTGTPCYQGTEDLGVRDDAYDNGNRIKIRLCALGSITGSVSSGVPGANGRALVSSIASESWQKLGEAARVAGVSLSAGSSWRTMAMQQELCNKNESCRTGKSYNAVAKPGTSNHQAGTALDISEIYASIPSVNNSKAASGRTCANPQTSSHPTYAWMAANARRYGVKNYANEAWHWGTSESC